MWEKIRWIFPVIFAGIIVFKIYGHFTPPRRQVLPTHLATRDSDAPHAGQVSEIVVEPVDKEHEAEDAAEPIEPPRSRLPVVVIVAAVGLTAGYFGIRRVWGQ